MFELSQWLVFVSASLALVAIPGPAVAFIVARTIEGGRRLGLVTALGIGLGNLLHAIAAALGVSALAASNESFLVIIRYAGAAYLFYLGMRSLVARSRDRVETEVSSKVNRYDLLKGVLVALLNPKVILFLVAFLPQFADPLRGSVSVQMLVLGTVFVLIGWLGDSAWALIAGSANNCIKRRNVSGNWSQIYGIVCILLSLLAVWGG